MAILEDDQADHFLVNIVIVVLLFVAVNIGFRYCQKKFDWHFLRLLLLLFLLILLMLLLILLLMLLLWPGLLLLITLYLIVVNNC